MSKIVSGHKREKLVGFHYRRNRRDLGWSLGERAARKEMLAEPKPCAELNGAEKGKRLRDDGVRQGLIMRLEGETAVQELAVVKNCSGEVYWAAAVDWVRKALQVAGVGDENLQQIAEAIVQASSYTQPVNVEHGFFQHFSNHCGPMWCSMLRRSNQVIEAVSRHKPGYACPNKFFEFVVEDGRLTACRIRIASDNKRSYRLKNIKNKAVILKELLHIRETVQYHIDFTTAGWPVQCHSMVIDVDGDSFMHDVIESGMVHVVAGDVGRAHKLPVFSNHQSFFDVAKHWDAVNVLRQITDNRLRESGISRTDFEYEVDKYIVGRSEKVFLDPKQKKQQMLAAWNLRQYFDRPSFARFAALSEFQEVLSKGSLNALFRRCMSWMSSRPLDNVRRWFSDEKRAVFNVRRLHDREFLKKDLFITYFDEIKNRHRSTLFVVHKGLTLLHRIASYRIDFLPYALDQLTDKDRYQVLSHPGRGYSVLSIVAYGTEVGAMNAKYLRQLLQEINKLTPEQQDAILAMPAMNGGLLSEKENVRECLQAIGQSARASDVSMLGGSGGGGGGGGAAPDADSDSESYSSSN